MTFAQSVSTCFAKYADVDGRATRSEYWWFVLFHMIVSIIVTFVSAQGGTVGGMVATSVNMALWLPSTFAATRRLHDAGRSGWWQLVALTVVGAIPLLIWLASEGERRDNRFGPSTARPGTLARASSERVANRQRVVQTVGAAAIVLLFVLLMIAKGTSGSSSNSSSNSASRRSATSSGYSSRTPTDPAPGYIQCMGNMMDSGEMSGMVDTAAFGRRCCARVGGTFNTDVYALNAMACLR